MMDINVELHQWSITFLIKKTSGSDIKNENISNKELADELHKKYYKIKQEKEKYTQLLYTISAVLILPICN